MRLSKIERSRVNFDRRGPKLTPQKLGLELHSEGKVLWTELKTRNMNMLK